MTMNIISQKPQAKHAAKLRRIKNAREKKIGLVKKRLMDFEQSYDHASSYRANDVQDMPGNAIVPIIPSSGVMRSAMDVVQETRDNLQLCFPSFSKRMLKSHVTGGFWLGLPRQFCKQHLPSSDSYFVLVDEDGKEYDVKYLANKNGLSGGWRGFAIDHKLMDGDALVFQLIEPLKLKVYITRGSQSTELDGVSGLLHLKLDVGAKPMDTEEPRKPARDVDSGAGTDIWFSEYNLEFKDVKSFENFVVHVDGIVLDSEIPLHVRQRYYELCCSQNMFLHENVTGGFNIKLVIGMISETINITDAVRLVKSTTSASHMIGWDRTLKAFEELGMTVGFLRARIHKLISLARESKAVIESKKRERAEAENVMTSQEETS